MAAERRDEAVAEAAGDENRDRPDRPLRTGFTTGACAAAAARAAATALWTGAFPPVAQITLPQGQRPVFALSAASMGPRGPHGAAWAEAGVVKDAGDDPDVTHGVTVLARLSPGRAGDGLTFRAGAGVGRVTQPGLPLAVGEPAINPAPRALISREISAAAKALGRTGEPLDLDVEISIPGGEDIAKQTWNPRLGILGGLSILGTTGIVKPYSCAAWIASIHRGVDVARAAGARHALAATGSTSEKAVRAFYDAPDWAILDMGDFAGGLLKYLRGQSLPKVTIAGGFAKLTKLAQGAGDLHSGRSQVDFAALGDWAAAADLPATPVREATTAMAALSSAGPRLANIVASRARRAAMDRLAGAPVEIEILVVDRAGAVVGRAGFAPPER